MNNYDTSLLSKHWQKFFNRFDEIETLKNCKWTEIHQLAYICKRYKEYYKNNFVFSLNTKAPSKCTEIVLVKKMCAMLGTSNPTTIREYIDWVFDKKIIPNKMKIRTLAFFMSTGLGNEFLLYRQEKNKIDRSTELPTDYKTIVDELELPITTYGELAFAKSAVDQNPEGRASYKAMFDKLLSIGFEFDIIKDLK